MLTPPFGPSVLFWDGEVMAWSPMELHVLWIGRFVHQSVHEKGATNRIIAFGKTPTNIIKVIDEKMYFFKLQMSAFEDLKYK